METSIKPILCKMMPDLLTGFSAVELKLASVISSTPLMKQNLLNISWKSVSSEL